MPAKQVLVPPAIRTVLAIGTSLCSLAINCHGLYYRITTLRELRPTEGNHRPFTKMAYFIPLKKERKTATDLAKIFAREVWKFHGLLTDIVSDRDSRFTSEVWKDFLRLLAIHPRMLTAFHPQTDGQTERLNQTIKAYLRAFVGREQKDWASLLVMAEFTYNNSVTVGPQRSE